MKRKILLVLTILFASILLVACNDKNGGHKIKYVEKETLVLWTSIELKFTIDGEDDNHKITKDSLIGTIKLDGKAVSERNATYSESEEHYRVLFSNLKRDTEYEVTVTASINQQKVTLFKEKLTTLLIGSDADNPIVINTVSDWENITNSYAFYQLGADLDFNGQELPNVFSTGLRGGFDGKDHTIKNFKVGYLNFNGIFGNMNSGTARVQNLTIENVNYDNYENIENKKLTSLYVGIVTKEVATGAKISNVTLKDINVRLYTELYGIRYFGIVTGTNRGTVENITLDNVNMSVVYNTSNESIIGGIVGKNYSTGTVSKVHYASGEFTVESGEYTTNPQTVNPSYIGGIVGESIGKVEEVVNDANMKLVDYKLLDDETVVIMEGKNVEIKKDDDEVYSRVAQTTVKLGQSFEIRLKPTNIEAIDKLLVNGVDKTSEVVDNVINLTASEERILIQAIYKNTQEEPELTITKKINSTFKVFLEDGTEAPEGSLERGTKVTIRGQAKFGKVTAIKINGVSYPLTNNEVEYVMENSIEVEVLNSSTKALYYGGIVGAANTLENTVFRGDFEVNLRTPYRYYEIYNVSGLAGRLYRSIKNSAVINSNASISSYDYGLRTQVYNHISSDGKTSTKLEDVAVVNSEILLNGISYDDGNEVVSSLPLELITSEFVQEILK